MQPLHLGGPRPIGPENGERFDRHSLDHRVFIMKAFEESWPNVQSEPRR